MKRPAELRKDRSNRLPEPSPSKNLCWAGKPKSSDRPFLLEPLLQEGGWKWLIAQNDVRSLLGHHDRWRIGVAGGDKGHHGGVDNSEAFDPTKFQVRGHDGLPPHSHGAGAGRMVVRLA